MQTHAVRRAVVLALCAVFAGCGGGSGGATIPGSGSATTPGVLNVGVTRVTPEYQPTAAPNEELLLLVNSCKASSVGCANHSSTIERYSLSTGAALPPIHLQTSTCAGGGARQMVASAGDQYFLSTEFNSNCQWQVEVDGANGSVAYLQNTNFNASSLLVSSDLSTVLANANGTTGVYHSPFRTASSSSSFWGTGTNSNGTAVFQPGSNGKQMMLAIQSLVTGQTTNVSWNSNFAPYRFSLYDARHAWFYFLATNSSGATFRLSIVDTAHDKYLGNIDLPGDPMSMSIDPTSSNLYVLIGQKAYVYNVSACGCVAPRRVLTMPSQTQNIAIDRNNQHLIAWYSTPYQTWYIKDLNPQTGAVQRSYPPVVSTSTVTNMIYTVLAQ